jgi:hypothetical protein
MLEPLSWAEICRRFPAQWVALLEVDWVDEARFVVRTALVAGSGALRSEATNRSRKLRSRFEQVDLCYTGI